MEFVDLHTHSYYSDGKLSPSELIDLAKKTGVEAIALTDHDITEGLEEAETKCKEYGIEFIPGIEISVEEGKIDIHVIGLWIDPKNLELNEVMGKLKQKRFERAKLMVKQFQELGYDLTFEDVLKLKKVGTIGKPHIVQALLNKKSNVSKLEKIQKKKTSLWQTVFNEYLGQNRDKEGEEKWKLSLKEAIELIHKAGGLAVIAHPKGYNYTVIPDETLEYAVSVGLDGIEAYYAAHKPEHTTHFLNFADKNNLIVSAGSDYHGSSELFSHMGYVDLWGHMPIKTTILDKIKENDRYKSLRK